MRVVVNSRPGGPEVLEVQERTPSELPSDGVRIKVAAAGINRADVLQREGNYKIPQGASDVLGLEVSGTVVEVGPDVDPDSGIEHGAEVCALVDSGGYSDEVVAPAAQVLPAPSAVTLEEAAGLPEVAATVWSNIFMEARAQEGETVLIHGGSGGVGTAAIQICKAAGLRVLTTVGSAEKAAYAQRLGAEPIRYDVEDFAARVKELTDGRGVDVILDVVGPDYLEGNLKSLAVDGRLVIIGIRGRTGQIDLGRLVAKRLHVAGTALRPRPAAQKAHIMQQVRDHVWPMIERGQVHVVVDRMFMLSQVTEAHEYFDSGAHKGKVLLRP